MEKEFVPYELALKLKQLGFDEPCFASYIDGKLTTLLDSVLWGDVKGDLPAPLFQQAFRWFRDEHSLEGIPQRASERNWYKFRIYQFYEDCKVLLDSKIEFNNYEEAELACLTKMIDVFESKQK